MTAELLCNSGTTLKVKTAIPPITGAVIVIIPASVLSTKVKAEGGLLYHSISFTVTGATQLACTGGTGAGVLVGATTKVNGTAIAFVKETQEVTILISGLSGGSPCSYNATIQIDDPGQTKVQGE